MGSGVDSITNHMDPNIHELKVHWEINHLVCIGVGQVVTIFVHWMDEWT